MVNDSKSTDFSFSYRATRKMTTPAEPMNESALTSQRGNRRNRRFNFIFCGLIAAVCASVTLMDYLKCRAEYFALKKEIDQWVSVRAVIPACRESHHAECDDAEKVRRVLGEIQFGFGWKRADGVVTTCGGSSIEIRSDEFPDVKITVGCHSVLTRRVDESGQVVQFDWFVNKSVLEKVAREFGFAWPLLSDLPEHPGWPTPEPNSRSTL